MNDDTIGMMLINNEEWSLVLVIKMTTDVILRRRGASAAKERDGGMARQGQKGGVVCPYSMCMMMGLGSEWYAVSRRAPSHSSQTRQLS